MARSKGRTNGRLEEAIAMLIQSQATLLARVSETDRLLAESNRQNAERFAKIEAVLQDHSRILADHSHILQELVRLVEAMPEAVRDKIGFRAPGQTQP